MSTKLITGIIIGAGAALAIGYLMTDEGSEVREKIKKSAKDILDNLSETMNKGKEIVKEYSENGAENVREGARH